MRIDLHVHTFHPPCSTLSLGEVLQNARGRGLDGVCITDHDTMDIRWELQEGYQEDGLCVIFGMEYATFCRDTRRQAKLQKTARCRPLGHQCKVEATCDVCAGPANFAPGDWLQGALFKAVKS